MRNAGNRLINRGGIPEQVEDGVAGFLVPCGDAIAMSTRINQLLNNEVLCKK